MDLRTLADVGQFLGGLGVIVSLVYLAVQIRDSTASQRSENYARSLERMATIQQLMARDAELTRTLNRGLVDPASLTPIQRIQFTWIFTEFFGGLEFMHSQSQQGGIPRDLWLRWEETLKWWLTHPGVRAWWRGKPAPFTPGFSRCVERCMESGYRPDRPGAWEAFLATGRPEPGAGERTERAPAVDEGRSG